MPRSRGGLDELHDLGDLAEVSGTPGLLACQGCGGHPRERARKRGVGFIGADEQDKVLVRSSRHGQRVQLCVSCHELVVVDVFGIQRTIQRGEPVTLREQPAELSENQLQPACLPPTSPVLAATDATSRAGQAPSHRARTFGS